MITDLIEDGVGIAQRSEAPSVSLAVIRPLLDVVSDSGVDTAEILDRYIADSDLAHASLSLVDYFKLERDIARATDDLTAHLSTRKLTYQTGSFVVDQVKKATTLTEAITSLAEYFNMMHGGAYNRVQRTAQTITLTIDDQDFPYSVQKPIELVQLIGECVQIKVHCLLNSLSDGLAASALQRVGVTRQTPDRNVSHLNFWPRPPQYQREAYALTYSLELADTRIPRADGLDLSSDGIFSRVIGALQDTDHSASEQRLFEKVVDLIEDGVWHQEQLADQLGMSVATLRRRLSEEGESFRSLVQAARLRRAEALLDKGYTIQQVTDAVGYSDIRAFNRAFKRWNGLTPAAFAKSR